MLDSPLPCARRAAGFLVGQRRGHAGGADRSTSALRDAGASGHHRVRGHDGGQLLHVGAAQAMAQYGETAALVVGEPERPVAELGLQRAVLLKDRGKGLGLVSVEPSA